MSGRHSDMHLLARLTVLMVVTVLVAACGSETGAGGTTDETPRGTRTVADDTDLNVVVMAGSGQRERTYTLRCGPPGGDHPTPRAACRQLEQLEDPFATVPQDTACTEIYGGPQTATVTGTFRGEPVDAQFSRTDGCQISRWDAHAVLLVERGGAQGT